MSAASGAPVGMEVDKEGKEGEEKKGETPEEDDRATRRSLEALRDYERKRSEAYAHVSARSVLESIDSDGKRRADAIQKQRDYAKRAFEEAMGANPDHELRTGEPFADDDEFNDLCKHLDHLSMLNVLAYRLARHYRRATRNNRITSNIEAILARVDEATKADSTVSLGELRYKGVAEMMNEIARIGHLKREQAQMTFLHEFQIACAPLAYGADWETHKLRFMIKWKLSRIDRMVLCMAPRRFGKTWAVAWFCLAFMLVVPGIRIAIFSQNQRTSASICEQLHQWLFCLPGGKDRSCSDSKTKVSVISEAAVAECRQARDKVKHPSKSTTLALPTTANAEMVEGGSDEEAGTERKRKLKLVHLQEQATDGASKPAMEAEYMALIQSQDRLIKTLQTELIKLERSGSRVAIGPAGDEKESKTKELALKLLKDRWAVNVLAKPYATFVNAEAVEDRKAAALELQTAMTEAGNRPMSEINALTNDPAYNPDNDILQMSEAAMRYAGMSSKDVADGKDGPLGQTLAVKAQNLFSFLKRIGATPGKAAGKGKSNERKSRESSFGKGSGVRRGGGRGRGRGGRGRGRARETSSDG